MGKLDEARALLRPYEQAMATALDQMRLLVDAADQAALVEAIAELSRTNCSWVVWEAAGYIIKQLADPYAEAGYQTRRGQALLSALPGFDYVRGLEPR